jgi:hypothetical protein
MSKFYDHCLETLYPPGSCGLLCNEHTYQCFLTEVHSSCCDEQGTNCQEGNDIPLTCPVCITDKPCLTWKGTGALHYVAICHAAAVLPASARLRPAGMDAAARCIRTLLIDRHVNLISLCSCMYTGRLRDCLPRVPRDLPRARPFGARAQRGGVRGL